MRKHATDNGKKVATSLRPDEQTESLTVAVRQGKENQWLYYSVRELEELESKLNKGPLGNDGSGEEEEDLV